MPPQNGATLAFNRGLLSSLGLARVDLTRYRMAAKVMTNWMPRVLGSMMLRPGGAFIGSTAANNKARSIPFVFGATDTAILEVTAGVTRVWVDDQLLTRPAVATAVTNGTFAASLAGWTDSSEAGAAVSWIAAGQVAFLGTTSSNAILDQEVAVGGADENTRHALRILVLRGPLSLLIGTAQGDDSILNETTLHTGMHSIAFTPGAANFWIRFVSALDSSTLLGTVTIEGPGVLTLPTPWGPADLPHLRWAQSADVVFVGAAGAIPQQFERRNDEVIGTPDSWSIVDYTQTVQDGPFRPINASNITITPSAATGDITLTASKPLFKKGHIGALFRLVSIGQAVTAALSGANTFTNFIEVNGAGAQRAFSFAISGSFTATLTLQYSVGAPGSWVDLQTVAASNPAFQDHLDNQTIFYRIGIKLGDYTSGTADLTLGIPTGSKTGIVRITGYTSSTVVNASTLTDLGNTTASTNWYEGAWSTFRGFPGVPSLWQGRLWWFGSSIFGSVSDAYNSFDDTLTGASAPIIGQFDSGPVENIYWAIGLQQLVVGHALAEVSVRSTYLGDAISETNFNTMAGSTQGSGNIDALQVDRSGVFVQISGQRVFTLDLDIYTYSYKSQELSLLVPDLNGAGIVQIAVQNKPDRRLHCIRADGTVGIMVWDQAENVNCWIEVSAGAGGATEDAAIEDVVVLPGVNQPEDNVYYTVRRVVNGQTVRYREKWAMERLCTGLPDSRVMDSQVFYAGSPTATLAAIAPHLAGQTVCVWGWNTTTPYVDGNGNTPGLDLGTYVVAGDGSVGPLMFDGAPYAVTNASVGLGYTADWESMKQAFASALGTPLNQITRIPRLGLILQNTHAQGLKVGSDFGHLYDLPLADLPKVSPEAGAAPDLNAVLPDYDQPMSGFDSAYTTDSHVCLRAASPRPCTVLAFTAELDTSG